MSIYSPLSSPTCFPRQVTNEPKFTTHNLIKSNNTRQSIIQLTTLKVSTIESPPK